MSVAEAGTVVLADDWGAPGWTMIPNGILRDPRLSYKAKGLVAGLASHDPGFRVTRDLLIRDSSDGKDAVAAGLRELREAGYLSTCILRDGRGRVTGTTYVLHRNPQVSTDAENPAAGESAPGDQGGKSGNGATCGNAEIPSSEQERKIRLHKKTTLLEEQNPPVGPPADAEQLALVEAQETPAERKRPAPAKKRATQIDKDFTPSEALIIWAKSNTPGIDPQGETQQFIDHYLATGKTMKDWNAAWRTWMRKARQWSRDKAPPSSVASTDIPEWCGECGVPYWHDERARSNPRWRAWRNPDGTWRRCKCHPDHPSQGDDA